MDLRLFLALSQALAVAAEVMTQTQAWLEAAVAAVAQEQ